MAKYPALPFWTDAYLGDTTHLTTLQHGAFLLLLFAMWRSKDCRIADNDRTLAIITGLSASHWKRARPVLEAMNRVEGGYWTNARLQDEREFLTKVRLNNSRAGKASALKRLHRDATPVERAFNNPSTPTPIPITTVVPNGTPVVYAAPPRGPSATRWKADDAVPFDWMAIASATRVRHGLPDIDLKLEAERFANHWSSKPGKDGLKLDWRKTWINWVLNAKGSGYGQGTGRAATAHEKFARAGLAIIASETGGNGGNQGDENNDPDTPCLPLLPP